LLHGLRHPHLAVPSLRLDSPMLANRLFQVTCLDSSETPRRAGSQNTKDERREEESIKTFCCLLAATYHSSKTQAYTMFANTVLQLIPDNDNIISHGNLFGYPELLTGDQKERRRIQNQLNQQCRERWKHKKPQKCKTKVITSYLVKLTHLDSKQRINWK